MATISLSLVSSILRKTPNYHICILGQRINLRLSLVFRRKQLSTAARSISSSVSTITEHDSERLSSSLSSSVLTFQQAIQRLQEYWASIGCAVMQCSNTED
ncbi:hypothetical protein OROMI_013802 [Orobanche minor]